MLTACSLLFTSIQYLSSSIEILSCCNTTSLSVYRPIVTGFAIGRSEDVDHFLTGVQQLSVCSDRSEPSIGFVEGRGGVKCTHHQLDSYSFNNGSLSTPGWYSLCFNKNNGCEECSVHLLCRLEEMEECVKVSVTGRFHTISSTNFTYPLKIGSSFPFSSSHVGIRISVSHIWDKETIQYKDIHLSSSDLSPSFSSLIPRHAYRLTRCMLHIKSNVSPPLLPSHTIINY